MWILLLIALTITMLIEDVAPADTPKRPTVAFANPSQNCFTEGYSFLFWNTPRFKYCSTDQDCKDVKTPGRLYGFFEYPICMDLMPNSRYAKGTYGVCCNKDA